MKTRVFLKYFVRGCSIESVIKFLHGNVQEFRYLVKKIVMLFMILGARKEHALSTIYVDNIAFKDDKVILLPNKTLKHSKPTRPLQPLIYSKLLIVKLRTTETSCQ